MPSFGPKINLNFDDVIYYKSNDRDEAIQNDWNSVLKPVVDELDELGVLESEKHLGGMGVQYESEVIYHNMLEELQKKNVVFTSIECAMREYPELVKKYFGKIVSNEENKFSALNGFFLYFAKIFPYLWLILQSVVSKLALLSVFAWGHTKLLVKEF